MDNSLKKPLLSEDTIDKNPFIQFEEWYGEAFRFLGEDASAMALSTSANHKPNSRIVYLRGSDKKGFWFFTNYNGQKGTELKKNKNACLLFFWPRLNRQIRIMGVTEKLSSKISNAYFASRERDSQLGAWSSPQSKKINNRDELYSLVEEFSKSFEEKKVPRPPYWGGYRLIPTSFEFWQGRESRLHDRIVYRKSKKGKWEITRLAP